MNSKTIKLRNKKGKGYHKLLIWKRLVELVKIVYKLTKNLPKTEDFGLITQMRRAVVSVISNFVEGYLERSEKNKLRYLRIANTSLMELEAQGEICRILGYWSDEEYLTFDSKRGEIAYLLYRYVSKIEKG